MDRLTLCLMDTICDQERCHIFFDTLNRGWWMESWPIRKM